MLIVLPSLLAGYGFSAMILSGAVAALLALVGATAVFLRIQPRIEEMPVDSGRWIRQASVVAVGSAAALGISSAQLWAFHRLFPT